MTQRDYLADAMRQAIMKDQGTGLMSESLTNFMKGIGSFAQETWRGMKADHAALHHELGTMRHAAATKRGATTEPYEQWAKSDPLLRGMGPKPTDGDPSFAAIDIGTMTPAGMAAGVLKGVSPKAQKAARNLMRKEFARRAQRLKDTPFDEMDMLVNEAAAVTTFRNFGEAGPHLPDVKKTKRGSAWTLGEPWGVSTSFDPYMPMHWGGQTQANRVLNLYGGTPSDVLVQGWKGSKHEDLLKDAYAYAYGNMLTKKLKSQKLSGELHSYDPHEFNFARDDFGKYVSEYLEKEGYRGIMYPLKRYKADDLPFGEAEIKMFNPAHVIKMEQLRSRSDPALARMYKKGATDQLPNINRQLGLQQVTKDKDYSRHLGDAIFIETNMLHANLNRAITDLRLPTSQKVYHDKVLNAINKDLERLESFSQYADISYDLWDTRQVLTGNFNDVLANIRDIKSIRQGKFDGLSKDALYEAEYLGRKRIAQFYDEGKLSKEDHGRIYNSSKDLQKIGFEHSDLLERALDKVARDRVESISRTLDRLPDQLKEAREALEQGYRSAPHLEKFKQLTGDKPGSLGAVYKEITPQDMQQRLQRLGFWE